MADWFETRFREPLEAERLDPAFAERVRRLVVDEWRGDSGSFGPDDIDQEYLEGDIIMLTIEDRTAGDEPGTPRQRPPRRWVAAAAAVVLVAVVGAFAVAAGDDDDEIDTATPTTTQPPAPVDIMLYGDEFAPLPLRTYVIDADSDDATPLRVTYEITAPGWESWAGAVKFDDTGHVALSIVTIDNVVRDGCNDHRPADPPVGPTVDDLAGALSGLAPFQVTAPPTDVTMFGYAGKHLALTVPELPVIGEGDDRLFSECVNQSLNSWYSPNLDDTSFFGYNGEVGRTEEFWILDVQGTRLVLVTTKSPDSPPQDVAELAAIFASIRIEP